MNNFRIETESDSNYINGIEFFPQSNKPLEVAATAHIHDTLEIIYVTHGNFTVYADDDKYEIFAGDLILFRSNVIHHIFTGAEEKNSYYVLKIRPEVVRDIAPPSLGSMYLLNFTFRQNDSKCVWKKEEIKSLPQIPQSIKILEEEFFKNLKYSDIAVKLSAGTILLNLLRSGGDIGNSNAAQAGDHTADCIYKAITYINQNYKSDITAKDVGSLVGMSYSFFSRTFKKITSMSFKQYLNLIRINPV